jgi:hypothetical protein
MNLNQLWIFYHAAKFKSFSLAAKELFLTQPSISTQVNSPFTSLRLIPITRIVERRDATEREIRDEKVRPIFPAGDERKARCGTPGSGFN